MKNKILELFCHAFRGWDIHNSYKNIKKQAVTRDCTISYPKLLLKIKDGERRRISDDIIVYKYFEDTGQ